MTVLICDNCNLLVLEIDDYDHCPRCLCSLRILEENEKI